MAKLRAVSAANSSRRRSRKADEMGVPVSIWVVRPEAFDRARASWMMSGFVTPETAWPRPTPVAAFRSMCRAFRTVGDSANWFKERNPQLMIAMAVMTTAAWPRPAGAAPVFKANGCRLLRHQRCDVGPDE